MEYPKYNSSALRSTSTVKTHEKLPPIDSPQFGHVMPVVCVGATMLGRFILSSKRVSFSNTEKSLGILRLREVLEGDEDLVINSRAALDPWEDWDGPRDGAEKESGSDAETWSLTITN
ncbi:hypothetical protein BT96DRAFT_939219 [Gymnopus androsaceus JB14]|uniref:Uncharacterized protein n=1 Tax=Gymnopus androsaceus JB14 TaxID=1447944 RepID=A0A6A4HMI4_9AGAR|nr:hypothetical protein BT96DRAFT_939219 [Gymnopus androsaceus JB14]